MRACGKTGGRRGQYPGAEAEARAGNGQRGPGKILVVGLGPGDRELLTPQALGALQDSEVIVGYRSYMKLIADLGKGKEMISSGMRREVDRARKAVDLARQGKVVSVVSSGDPGIYGMAGLVLELAPPELPVEVIPGITAASAAAAALGAPLMNDFVVISLSDLLTPWEKILKRLEAAGLGDLAVVLYNPKSKERPANLAAAREVLLTYQDPKTPVGLVRKAKRGEETVVITSLEEMLAEHVDMLTVIIVGNSETRLQHGRLFTPRGYQI